MSHGSNNILGLVHGKIGDQIAIVLHGKQFYKRLYKPTNPQTPKQQMHRYKLAFANQLSAVLADAINLGFAAVPKADSGQSPRNAFVHENFNNGAFVWDEELGAWGIRPELLKLACGPRHIGEEMTAAVECKVLRITCPDPGLKDSRAVDDDQLMVAIYRPAMQRMHLLPGPMRKECGECDFPLPENAGDEEDMLLVYAWFQATRNHRSAGSKAAVRLNQASSSVFLGCLAI